MTSVIKPIVLFVFLISCTQGCGRIIKKKGMREGKIEYSITYLNKDEQNLLLDLLPTTMDVSFKGNNSCVELSGGMGMFTTYFIADYEKKSFIQKIKILGKKYVKVYDSLEVKDFYANYPPVKLELTKWKGGEIAGYRCKKAFVQYEDTTMGTFEALYTEKLGVDDPNWCLGPFSIIKGVLMKYNWFQYKLHMELTATKVSEEKIDDEIFKVSEDYVHLSTKEIDELFEGF